MTTTDATSTVPPLKSTIVRTCDTIEPREAAQLFAVPPAPRTPHVPEVAGLETVRSTLRVGEHELAVYSWVPPGPDAASRPTVLLAHGFGGSAAQLTAFVPELLTRGLRVVAFDQPAHGMSPGRSAHLVELARNISAVVRAFDARSVIAHSLGATATMIAHARGLPLRRAALIAPPGNVEHFATGFADFIGLPRAQLPQLLKEIEHELGLGLPLLDVRNLVSLAGDLPPAKVLVLHDPADAEVPYEHGRQLAHSWPGARLQTVTGLGHRRVLRDPAVIHSAIEHVEPNRSSASRESANNSAL